MRFAVADLAQSSHQELHLEQRASTSKYLEASEEDIEATVKVTRYVQAPITARRSKEKRCPI